MSEFKKTIPYSYIKNVLTCTLKYVSFIFKNNVGDNCS